MGHFFGHCMLNDNCLLAEKNNFEITRSALAETVTKSRQATSALH